MERGVEEKGHVIKKRCPGGFNCTGNVFFLRLVVGTWMIIALFFIFFVCVSEIFYVQHILK